jgi:hypothetical protein
MGLPSRWFDVFLDLCRAGEIRRGDGFLDIGASELGCRDRPEILNEFLAYFGAPPYPPDELVDMASFAFAGALFRRAGFRYAAVDYAHYPDTIRLDLNRQGLPWRHRGRYRFVCNAGTSEHIINQHNVFKVIHDAAAPGGLMFHSVPLADYEHGLITYSPKFFWYLARQNDYEIVRFLGNADGEATEMKPAFLRDIAFNKPPTAQKTWIRLLLRKTGTAPFRGINDESFSPEDVQTERRAEVLRHAAEARAK